jgi:methionyl-tRNA formyltransferase
VRIMYFANNRLGWKILEWLRGEGEDVVGLAIHPPGRSKFGDEIVRTAALPPSSIFDAAQLRDPDVQRAIGDLRPEIGISVLFGYILRPALLERFAAGVINLHPSLLPRNRGACPNVWSIVSQTRAGVALHYLDAGIDTGDVIARETVAVEPIDTGGSLYRKLEQASFELFCRAWPEVRERRAGRTPQSPQEGTRHTLRDLESIAEIDLDRQYTGRELIDILRARTFPPYAGAFFRAGDRRIHMRLELEYADEPHAGN